ncbi:hypothetical protein [Paenibacillus sp. FSL K6-2862]|uniref:hypothetical protein n=1 Tax=Paenibacillus sp. FSL K6-2862 TaxID=2921484 RepID=UPI0030F9FB1B
MVQGSPEIQGLISFEKSEGYVSISLVESAPWNIGNEKQFIGVGAHLFAIACKYSFDQGFDGVVAFTAKTKLLKHYQETLGAVVIGGHLMAIETPQAHVLVSKYFE